MKLQLVIPMSGQGSRFARVGYTDPKPLIKIDDHPMIEWVLRMFPGEEEPLFICRREHIENTAMAQILTDLRPNGRIAVTEGAKLGPVAALMAAADEIDNDRPVLVSYCDYYMRWDYDAFKAAMAVDDYLGAVPCYKGFHPHLLPVKNLYASCRVDAQGNLIEIREKYSFEADKTKALHSPGIYYFHSGGLMKKYCTRLMDTGDSLNGEYYVSMVYNHLIRDGLRVAVPEGISHFCQWGTPEDLDEYRYWTAIARKRQS
ncbi:NTP transferase domain-containing protein [Ochrobactrum pecoris]|uniref:Capsular biosynthesis protein n=1 Tax=Brucella pecoris TaxID=867683 RepID=A0A5C5CC00_9HYPH|nr:glycosyltransferase family 2 protein [Brucella pecoris]MBB4096132.1 NDP-sugar pyrophosphorylase family protein [Brucella pecoris]NKW80866.1 NTP transferase domain-containing protein [Brucella pecoris]TNV08879.1 capsular biosynthesis protein [Brucella pecoris]